VEAVVDCEQLLQLKVKLWWSWCCNNVYIVEMHWYGSLKSSVSLKSKLNIFRDFSQKPVWSTSSRLSCQRPTMLKVLQIDERFYQSLIWEMVQD